VNNVNGKRIAVFVFSATLFIVSALAWLSYVGQGIAYGDLVGVAGREKDIAALGSSVMRAFWTAASCEALAIGLLSWFLTDPSAPGSVRLVKSLVVAAFADVLTYAFVRGIA
jgi:hypothetical protein